MTRLDRHDDCEVFRFLARCWCVTHALALVEADPTVAEFIEAVDITGLDGYLDLTPPAQGMLRLFVVKVDKEYALTQTDLERPILLVPVMVDGEDAGCLMIDGWHRVYRARVEGRPTLPALLLSVDAELAVRIQLV